MARFLAGSLLLVVLALAAFAAWMRSGGGTVADLSEDEVAAARESGAGARELAVDADGDGAALPTLAEIDEVCERAEADALAERVRAAREAASGADRDVLTVLLAELERIRGNVDAARELATEGAEALPRSSKARYTLARAIMSHARADIEDRGAAALLGAIGTARRCQAELAAAVELDPANLDALVRYILTLAYFPWPLEDEEKAAELTERIGEIDPFRRDFWRVQLLVTDEDNLDAAIAGFRALDGRRPGDADVVYNLGELFAKKDDFREAARQFDRLLEGPRTRRAYQALYQGAKAREHGGFELERALEMLDEYLAADPVGEFMTTMDRVHYHRGNVLAALGRTDEARAAYERALEIEPGAGRVENALARLGAGGTGE